MSDHCFAQRAPDSVEDTHKSDALQNVTSLAQMLERYLGVSERHRQTQTQTHRVTRINEGLEAYTPPQGQWNPWLKCFQWGKVTRRY